MASTDLNIKTKLQLESLAIVRPGDTLIVAVGTAPLAANLAEEYRERIKERLPGVDVLVLNAAQLAVYRPDGSES